MDNTSNMIDQLFSRLNLGQLPMGSQPTVDEAIKLLEELRSNYLSSKGDYLSRIRSALESMDHKNIKLTDMTLSDNHWLSFNVKLVDFNMVEFILDTKNRLLSLYYELPSLVSKDTNQDNCEIIYHIDNRECGRHDGSIRTNTRLVIKMVSVLLNVNLDFIPDDAKLRLVINYHGNGLRVEMNNQ